MPVPSGDPEVLAVASRLVLGGGAGANLRRIDGSDTAGSDDSRKRCRRLSNSHGNAAVAELSPSMPSPATTSPRFVAAGCVDHSAWLQRGYQTCWTATLRKKKRSAAEASRPESLAGKGGAGVGHAARLRRSCAFAGEVHASDVVGLGVRPLIEASGRYREPRPFDAASRRRAFCTDGSAALAFANGRARTSTLAAWPRS